MDESRVHKPEITVVFLLYNAEKTVEKLFNTVCAQTHPSKSNQGQWLKVIFMDDFSQDHTVQKLELLLNENKNLEHFKLIRNTPNLGLSRTINKACEIVDTPYILTCHCDSFFGSDTYVFDMLNLIKGDSKIAAITGKPVIHYNEQTPFFEKLNTISNLMDVFPEQVKDPLVQVGFAEGRCDIFNLEAVKKAGLYDTKLRTSGEDQVLNAKLRELGYKIFIAPNINYTISVSTEQDSILKIAKHQKLFAQTSPYILFSSRRSLDGLVGESAGRNRSLRTFLRLSQIFSFLSYLLILLFFLSSDYFQAIVLLFIIIILKSFFFMPYFKIISTTYRERFLFVFFQPIFDAYYSIGFFQGLLKLKKLLEK